MRDVFRQFREKHMKKKIAKTTSLKRLEKYREKCPLGLQPLIATRYKELLPEYLEQVTSFKELEERLERCPSSMGMGSLIKIRYKELLEKVTSREELEKHYEKRSPGMEDLVSDRYEELLIEDLKHVASQEELEKHWKKCPPSLRFTFFNLCKEFKTETV